MPTALLLAFPSLILAFHALSFALPGKLAHLASFVARLLTSWGLLCVCTIYGVIASLFLRVVGYGGLGQWTTGRVFKYLMWPLNGVTFEVVEGQEYMTSRPAVFLGNHQTELDVLMLACIFPKYCSVTAKKSLKYYPFLGWFMTASKTVFIDRGNRNTARAAFDNAAAQMRKERQSVFIFPEGTRSYATKPEMLPFKKGAFHLAIQAQVPIVPVVAENYSWVLNVKERKFKSGKIKVVALPPIETKGLTKDAVDDLSKQANDAMLKELKRLYDERVGSQGTADVKKES